MDSDKLSKETEEHIKELQILEQNLQAILMQKQAFQAELGETENAFEEISKSGEEVFRIVGNIMIKSSKQEISKDLKQKKDLISLRLKTLDNQEKSLEEKAESLRKKVLSKIKKD
jgi:prefoldin beta subunit